MFMKNYNNYYISEKYKQVFKALENNQMIYGYHGTNREFDKFDIKLAREYRIENFSDKIGIYFSFNLNVAKKYANANINDSLPLSIIDDAKKVNNDLYNFMYGLYHNGNSTWSDEKLKDFLKKGDFNGVDCNDIANIVNLIPGSQSEKDYHSDDDNEHIEFVDFFSNSYSALNQYIIDDIEKLGLGNYNPKVYVVKIKPTTSYLISKNLEEIKNSNADIIVVYDIPDLIDDEPEIIVQNLDLLEIFKVIEDV